MGLTRVTVNVGRGRKAIETDCLVDSGATYTLLPERIWKRLGIEAIDELKFTLADGRVITRRLSEAWVEYGGKGRTVQVIMGEKGDEALLGAMTLEALGLVLNPFTRELMPMRLMLA
ncbi:MAG: aspartyl protease family protein [Kiritimatiellae bacterium]|nr:aspartyl protease family protein [Kiritimatiellia bacterium]